MLSVDPPDSAGMVYQQMLLFHSLKVGILIEHSLQKLPRIISNVDHPSHAFGCSKNESCGQFGFVKHFLCCSDTYDQSSFSYKYIFCPWKGSVNSWTILTRNTREHRKGMYWPLSGLQISYEECHRRPKILISRRLTTQTDHFSNMPSLRWFLFWLQHNFPSCYSLVWAAHRDEIQSRQRHWNIIEVFCYSKTYLMRHYSKVSFIDFRLLRDSFHA